MKKATLMTDFLPPGLAGPPKCTWLAANSLSAPMQYVLTVICARLILPSWYTAEQFFASPVFLAMGLVGYTVYKSKTKAAKFA